MSAVARLMPCPPARVLMRYTPTGLLGLLKARTSISRLMRFVSPSSLTAAVAAAAVAAAMVVVCFVGAAGVMTVRTKVMYYFVLLFRGGGGVLQICRNFMKVEPSPQVSRSLGPEAQPTVLLQHVER